MVHMLAYFIATYAVAILLSSLLMRAKYPGSAAFRGVMLAFLLALPLAPYGVVELQTALCGKVLLTPATKARMVFYGISDVREMKVLRLSPWTATLYVVIEDSVRPSAYSGFVVKLARSHGRWDYAGEWDVVWSDTGSAHGNVFPPYRTEGDYR